MTSALLTTRPTLLICTASSTISWTSAVTSQFRRANQKVAFCLECLRFSVDFWQHPGLSPKRNYGCELFWLNILSRKEKDHADDDAHEYHT